ECETALRQWWQWITLGQTRVGVPQPAVFGAEDLHGLRHLLTADGRDVLQNTGLFHRGVEDVTAFTTGAGDHHDPVALSDIAGHGGGALAGLVVGVGVDRQQAQTTHVYSSFP